MKPLFASSWVLLIPILFCFPFSEAVQNCGSDVWSTLLANKHNAIALRSIDAPSWVAALEFRDTFAILQSCILTLFACIYTALHLNVPPRTDFRSLLVDKTVWVALTLFAPEFVLYAAASQFLDALRLRKELKALQAKSNKVDKNFDFSLKYCFYFVMGGAHIGFSKLAKFMTIVDADPPTRRNIDIWLNEGPNTIRAFLI